MKSVKDARGMKLNLPIWLPSPFGKYETRAYNEEGDLMQRGEIGGQGAVIASEALTPREIALFELLPKQ